MISLEAARSVIDAAPILPAQEEVLRRDAKVGSVHYSNVIEGNELPLLEAARAALIVYHVAPGESYEEVDRLMTERLEWLEAKRSQ